MTRRILIIDDEQGIRAALGQLLEFEGYEVHAVANAVEIPLVGMGGVQSGRDALDLVRAGAIVVAVGTESFRDPAAAARIRDELAKFGGVHGYAASAPAAPDLSANSTV